MIPGDIVYLNSRYDACYLWHDPRTMSKLILDSATGHFFNNEQLAVVIVGDMSVDTMTWSFIMTNGLHLGWIESSKLVPM